MRRDSSRTARRATEASPGTDGEIVLRSQLYLLVLALALDPSKLTYWLTQLVFWSAHRRQRGDNERTCRKKLRGTLLYPPPVIRRRACKNHVV